jgi:hypothetical protein
LVFACPTTVQLYAFLFCPSRSILDLLYDIRSVNPSELVLLGAGGKRPKVSKTVKVVNSVTNDRGLIRRKDAEFFVNEKRAEWVGAGQDQIRLIMSHPKNQAAARRAAAWTLEPTPMGTDRISQTLQRYGTRVLDRHSRPCGLEATDNPRLTSRPTPIRRGPWRRVSRDAVPCGFPAGSYEAIWIRQSPNPFEELLGIYEALIFDSNGQSIKTIVDFAGDRARGVKVKLEPEIPNGLLRPDKPGRPRGLREITHGAVSTDHNWRPRLGTGQIRKMQATVTVGGE